MNVALQRNGIRQRQRREDGGEVGRGDPGGAESRVHVVGASGYPGKRDRSVQLRARRDEIEVVHLHVSIRHGNQALQRFHDQRIRSEIALKARDAEELHIIPPVQFQFGIEARKRRIRVIEQDAGPDRGGEGALVRGRDLAGNQPEGSRVEIEGVGWAPAGVGGGQRAKEIPLPILIEHEADPWPDQRHLIGDEGSAEQRPPVWPHRHRIDAQHLSAFRVEEAHVGGEQILDEVALQPPDFEASLERVVKRADDLAPQRIPPKLRPREHDHRQRHQQHEQSCRADDVLGDIEEAGGQGWVRWMAQLLSGGWKNTGEHPAYHTRTWLMVRKTIANFSHWRGGCIILLSRGWKC